MVNDCYPNSVVSYDSMAESFVHMVKLELGDIRKAFVSIGYRLNEANRFNYYDDLGYSSIEELAEAEFGFKRSTTYNLMVISRRFGSGFSLRDEYRRFSYSQLVSMVPMLKYIENPYTRCCSSRSISEFNEYYKYLKSGGRANMETFFSTGIEAETKVSVKSLSTDITNDCVIRTSSISSNSLSLSVSVPEARKLLEDAFARDYTVIFNNDSKTGGVRVVPSAVVDIIFDVLHIEE